VVTMRLMDITGRSRRITAGALAAATLLILISGAAHAAPEGPADTIEVFPGPNAIADALGVANPGDILNIHAGTYPENLSVTTEGLTMRAAGDGTVTVDGECQTQYTIEVRTDGLTIQGLRVIGAAEGFGGFPAEVDFSGVSSGTIRDSVLRDTCDAEYGVNLYQTGAVRVIDNVASGFSDAGIYVGAISGTGGKTLVVRGNRSFGNWLGIIVEESAGGSILVTHNDVHDNERAGIYVPVSDGVVIRNNEVMDNGQGGIELTGGSDHNVISRNTALGHTFDLSNDGTDNCFRSNVYVTSDGDISC
jgi:parallel beta-helix repeat protein